MDFSKFKQNGFVHLLIFIIVLGSGLVISLLQAALFVTVYPFSKTWYRRLNYYLCFSFYSEALFMVDWWAGLDFTIYINKHDLETYYGKEHGLCVMNHTYDIDWILGYMFCNSIHTLGNCKAYIKKVLQYIPIIGWIWYFGDMVLLERSFDKDKETIRKQLANIVAYPSPCWLLIFPEGTRYTPTKYQQSLTYAKENNLPIYKHHLTPRTKGFTSSLEPKTGKFGALYDILLSFEDGDKCERSVADILNGRKMKAHCYIKRIPFDEVPLEEEKAKKYLLDLFVRKDKLQDSFMRTGDYFAESGVERETNVYKLKHCPYALANFTAWSILILSFLFKYFIDCLLLGNYLSFTIGASVLIILSILMKKLMKFAQKKSKVGSPKK